MGNGKLFSGRTGLIDLAIISVGGLVVHTGIVYIFNLYQLEI